MLAIALFLLTVNSIYNKDTPCVHCTEQGCSEPKSTDGIDPGVGVCFKKINTVD